MRQRIHIGFTLLEVLIVVMTIAILGVMLMPTTRRKHEMSCSGMCAMNMGQIHKAITMYETDFSCFPTRAAAWNEDQLHGGDAQEALNLLYRAYTDDVRIFSCPSKPLAPELL